MNIYIYENYKAFTNDFIRLKPSNGRGQYLKISKVLGIHSTMVSHIFKGDKDLTLEHGHKLCDFLGLSELETEYFITLIEVSRAGTSGLEKYYNRRLNSIKDRSKKISERLPTKKKLDNKDKAQFYSSWIYSAVRLLSSVKGYQTKTSLMNYFDLPARRSREVMDFLMTTGLCKLKKNKIEIGPTHLHLESESSLIFRHHGNWRQKGIERHETLTDDELMFSAPLTISKDDIPKVRELALKFVQDVRGVVDNTDPEKLMCLNIDWFEVK